MIDDFLLAEKERMLEEYGCTSLDDVEKILLKMQGKCEVNENGTNNKLLERQIC